MASQYLQKETEEKHFLTTCHYCYYKVSAVLEFSEPLCSLVFLSVKGGKITSNTNRVK